MKQKVSFSLREGKYISCQIRINNTQASFLTGMKIDKKYWDRGRIISRKKEFEEMSDKMVDISRNIRKIQCKRGYTAKTIMDIYQGKKSESTIPQGLIEMLDYTHNTKMRDVNVGDKSAQSYSAVASCLKEYLFSINEEDLDIHEVLDADIMEFFNWMRIEKGLKPRTAHHYITLLNSAINFCVRVFKRSKDMPPANPIMDAVRMSKKESLQLKKASQSNHLTLDQVKQIQALDLGDGKSVNDIPLEWYRLTVLWQLYTGVSYSDIGSNEWSIQTNIRNDKFIVIDREKTSEPCTIPLQDHTMDLLDRLSEFEGTCGYKGKFPISYGTTRDYHRYRDFINQYIAPVVGQKIGSHTFRHTFAQLALRFFGYQADDVRMMLGHANVSTTLMAYGTRNLDSMQTIKKVI